MDCSQFLAFCAIGYIKSIENIFPCLKKLLESITITCWLNGNNSEIVLELKTAVAPDSLKNALVTASYLGIKRKMMLNKTSIWKTSWGWNLPPSVQPTCAGWIVGFEILIDLKPNSSGGLSTQER